MREPEIRTRELILAGKDELNSLYRLIRDGSAHAIDSIKSLESVCVHDAKGQSPFDVAIEVGHSAILDLLLAIDEAREFAPPVHPTDRARFMKTIYSTESLDDIDLAESRILDVVDGPPYWQRTPLLQACRRANREAIDSLIARGAKLTTKDLVGETPLSLCLKVGGLELARFFVESCIAHKKRIPVTNEMLGAAVRDTAFYRELVAHSKLGASTKRFIFNLACATLDTATIERMLEDGLDINSTITYDANPIQETITAKLAWLHEAQDWRNLAAGYAHAHGHPQAISITIPPDADPAVVSYGKIKAQHTKLNASVRRKEIDPTFMSTQQKLTRLSLLDKFITCGLDVQKVEDRLDFPLIGDVITTNEPEFIQALLKHGFNLAPKSSGDDMEIAGAIRNGCFSMVDPLKRCGHPKRRLNFVPKEKAVEFREWRASGQDAPPLDLSTAPKRRKKKSKRVPAVTWELSGESVLEATTDPAPPRAGEPCRVQVLHSNVYGPLPAVGFSIRALSLGAGDNTDSETWQALELVDERVFIDGEAVSLESLDEAPYGETPWDGIFVLETTFPVGRHRIEIKISAPAPEESDVLSDWVVVVT